MGDVIYGGVDHGNTLYSVNPSNGTLTAVGTGNIGGGYALIGSTTSGLYALGWDDALYSINAVTGAAAEIGSTGMPFGTVMGMSAGSNTVYVTTNDSLYSLNLTNGSATLVGTINTNETGFGALVSIGGVLYAGAYSPSSSPNVYTVDPQTGAATFVAASPSTPSAPSVAGFWGLAPLQQGDATWLSNPLSVDWNNGLNRSTSSVPTTTAIFGTSTITTISLSPSIGTSIGTMIFVSGAPSYQFAVNQNLDLTGDGVIGSSSAATFNIAGNLQFHGTSTAGSSTINNNFQGDLLFKDNSTAGNATINNNAPSGGGVIVFFNSSTAGTATITNSDTRLIEFDDNSSAANATIINKQGGSILFTGDSTSENARFVNDGSVAWSGLIPATATAGSIEGSQELLILGIKRLLSVV
jgi:hypothetical protein